MPPPSKRPGRKQTVPVVMSPSWPRKAQPVVVPRSSARMVDDGKVDGAAILRLLFSGCTMKGWTGSRWTKSPRGGWWTSPPDGGSPPTPLGVPFPKSGIWQSLLISLRKSRLRGRFRMNPPEIWNGRAKPLKNWRKIQIPDCAQISDFAKSGQISDFGVQISAASGAVNFMPHPLPDRPRPRGFRPAEPPRSGGICSGSETPGHAPA